MSANDDRSDDLRAVQGEQVRPRVFGPDLTHRNFDVNMVEAVLAVIATGAPAMYGVGRVLANGQTSTGSDSGDGQGSGQSDSS